MSDEPNEAQKAADEVEARLTAAEAAVDDLKDRPLTEPKEVDRRESPCGCIVVTYDDESQQSQPCLACSYKGIGELYLHIAGMHAMAQAQRVANRPFNRIIPATSDGRPIR